MIATNPLTAPCPYDVGDILHTTNATPPSTRWPGTTWQAITTMLLGASSAHRAGETGGAEKVYISMDNLPQYTIVLQGVQQTEEWCCGVWGGQGGLSSGSYVAKYAGESIYGGSNAISTMPPYTSVYIWRRTG